MRAKIPVIYIAGSSHSGSTILDLVLGSHSSIESVGEAKKVGQVVEAIKGGGHPRCTCQKEVGECAFWQHVLRDSPGDIQRDPAANAAFFERVLTARGKLVVLDSSKTIGRALLVARPGLLDTLVVQLVRDSRAVCFSSKRKLIQGRGKSPGLVGTARGWQKLNLRIQRKLFNNGGDRRLVVRYEDFTADPESVLKSILACVGLPWEPAMLRYREHIHHNIEGNRMRMGSGSEIKHDEEYLRALGSREWCVATLLTWRGLRRFGYPLKRSPVEPLAGAATPSLR